MTHPEDPRRPHVAPTVVGVLGGIASGKSAVARLLAGQGGVVLDADRLAQEVLAQPRTARWLEETFGPGILTSEGKPDREALGELVFSDPAARERLEGWIHPAVREKIRAGLEEARAAARSPIVLDVPLLLEHDQTHGLTGECDFLVYIETDAEDRERRAQERRGWPPDEVARRERAQIPLEEKRARARHVIENRSGLAELKTRVHEILEAEQIPN
jgi:dephospho-CoA kinase